MHPQAVRRVIRLLDIFDQAVCQALRNPGSTTDEALVAAADLMIGHHRDPSALEEVNQHFSELNLGLRLDMRLDRFDPEDGRASAALDPWITDRTVGLVLCKRDTYREAQGFASSRFSWVRGYLLPVLPLEPLLEGETRTARQILFPAQPEEDIRFFKDLNQLLGIRFVRYLALCPRVPDLPGPLQREVGYEQDWALDRAPYYRDLSSEVHVHWDTNNPSLDGGLLVWDPQPKDSWNWWVPESLGELYQQFMDHVHPVSWLVASHLARGLWPHEVLARRPLIQEPPPSPFCSGDAKRDRRECLIVDLICRQHESIAVLLEQVTEKNQKRRRPDIVPFIPRSTLVVTVVYGEPEHGAGARGIRYSEQGLGM